MTATTIPAEAAFNRVVSPRGGLYALIDAARESAGPYQAEQAAVEFQSLYAGQIGNLLKNVAPYLVEFRGRSSFRTWFFERWGNGAGILIESPADLWQLRRHFRTLMIVRDEQLKKHYFRFYDPRVLRVFLPACTPEEIIRFFGPITAFYCEGDGGELLTYTRNDKGELATKITPV